MARPPKKTPDPTSGFVDPGGAGFLRGDDRWEAAGGPGPVGPAELISSHVVRGVVVLGVSGRLGDVAQNLVRAVELALADDPRGVVCDLSEMSDDSPAEDVQAAALARVATAGRHARDWPAIPVAVVCPDPQARATLNAQPMGGHLIVAPSLLSALTQVLATPSPTVDWLLLAPHPTAPRAARDFVTRALLDRGLGRAIPSASLVISELVTNSTMYAGTDMAMSVVWDLGALRLTVRDDDPTLPHHRHSALDLHGRGLTIIAGLSRAFGVLPTADGGKVVWSVIDAPAPRSPLTNGSAPSTAGMGS